MNSIRDEWVALDTNEFIFAFRQDGDHPFCETLLFDHLPELQLYFPLQILVELQRNLDHHEMQELFFALTKAKNVIFDYSPAPIDRITYWRRRGAKKGDAVIVSHLEMAQIPIFVSENRHFLLELLDLPFAVITSEKAVLPLTSG